MKNKAKWIQMLVGGEAGCYFKPTKGVHDSGYGCFEIGYCTIGDDLKVKDKFVLGKCSDHIWNWGMTVDGNIKHTPINMDLTLDGYIRVFDQTQTLWWEGFDFVVSTASIAVLTKGDILMLEEEVRNEK